MSNLYLHVGAPKTGTTAIQRALKQNQSKLQDIGYCYPDTCTSKFIPHYELIYPILDELKIIRRATIGVDRMLESYLSQGGNSNNYILSDESLYVCPVRQLMEEKRNAVLFNDWRVAAEDYRNLKENVLARLQDRLVKYFDSTKIVIYLRRQDEFLFSNYLEDVKHYGYFSSFENYDFYDFELDYYTNLDIWARTFGRENLIVRFYEKHERRTWLIEDFCEALGIPPHALDIDDLDINRSLPIEYVTYKKIINQFLSNYRLRYFFYDLMTDFTVETSGLKENSGKNNHESLRDKLSKLTEKNELISEEYFTQDSRLPVIDFQPWKFSEQELTVDDKVIFGLMSFISSRIVTRLFELEKRTSNLAVFDDMPLADQIRGLRNENDNLRETIQRLRSRVAQLDRRAGRRRYSKTRKKPPTTRSVKKQ